MLPANIARSCDNFSNPVEIGAEAERILLLRFGGISVQESPRPLGPDQGKQCLTVIKEPKERRMTMRHADTLYVVADGGRARFIRFTENQHFHTIKSVESEHIHERSHELGNTSPSRVQESASPTRHGVEPREDRHDRAERDFARHVAQTLNADQSLGDFDALVLAAPSKTLAELRGALAAKMAKKIAVNLAKDLTKIPDADLLKHLPRPSPVGFKA